MERAERADLLLLLLRYAPEITHAYLYCSV